MSSKKAAKKLKKKHKKKRRGVEVDGERVSLLGANAAPEPEPEPDLLNPEQMISELPNEEEMVEALAGGKCFAVFHPTAASDVGWMTLYPSTAAP